MARNRKKNTSNTSDGKSFTNDEGVTFTEIPMQMPNYGSAPTGKTLLDIIEEKRPRNASGTPIGAEEEDEEEIFGLGANTFFFVVPLVILLFWLDVLVHIQYRQETEWKLIFGRCAKALPVMYGIHYFFHPRRSWVTVRLFLLGMSVAAGCYIVRAVNVYGYYFVMKKTPPLGTLWIWAVIEMDLMGAVASVAGVMAYTWYYGYSIL